MSKKNRKNRAAAAAVVENLDVTLDASTELAPADVLAEGAEIVVADTEAFAEGGEIVLPSESESESEAIAEGAEIVLPSDVPESIVDDVAAELESEEAKQKAYASQEPEAPADPAAIPTTPAQPRSKRVITTGLKTSEAIMVTLGATPESYFALDANDGTDETSLKATMTSVLAAVDKLDKKSREKAIGVFTALKAGKLPSTYIMQTIEALRDSGPMTLKALTGFFLEKNYKPGTASRQAQQMFAVLPLLKIAKRGSERGAAMSLNSDSTLATSFLLAKQTSNTSTAS